MVKVWFWLVARGVLGNSRIQYQSTVVQGVVLVGSKGVLEISRFSIPKDSGSVVVMVGSKGVLEISRLPIPKDRGIGVVLVGSKGSYRKLQVFYTKVQWFRFGSGW